MKRALIALALAPVLVSLCFGWPGVVLVLPFAAALTVLLGAPLFIVFARRGWLTWWHAAVAGVVCGLIFVCLLDSPERLDAFGIEDALIYCGTGIAIGVVFWWLGLFRNPAFPAVPSKLPYSMIALVPVVALSMPVHESLAPTFAKGRIVAIKGEAPSRQITVRLSSGEVIETSLLRDSRPNAALINGCWHLTNHWSTWRFGRVYSLSAPFGGGVNDC